MAQGNVKVHEQGTASVNVTNATVPVHEQGTATVNVSGDTVLAGHATFEANDASIPVSQYKEMIGVKAASDSSCPGSDSGLNLFIDNSITLDQLSGPEICSIPLGIRRTYDIPGRTLAIHAFGASSFDVEVFKRSN